MISRKHSFRLMVHHSAFAIWCKNQMSQFNCACAYRHLTTDSNVCCIKWFYQEFPKKPSITSTLQQVFGTSAWVPLLPMRLGRRRQAAWQAHLSRHIRAHGLSSSWLCATIKRKQCHLRSARPRGFASPLLGSLTLARCADATDVGCWTHYEVLAPLCKDEHGDMSSSKHNKTARSLVPIHPPQPPPSTPTTNPWSRARRHTYGGHLRTLPRPAPSASIGQRPKDGQCSDPV